MASNFQQQARQRKLIYLGLILVLFTATFLWRTNAVASQAQKLAMREVDRGDVELTGSVVRLGLTGSRGLATCALWMSAIDKQKKSQWNELELLVRSVTKLQPHFITPWLFQSWNLAYNVSVESDRVADKYFYITRGIQLLAEGERQNRDNPDLRYWIGFYNQHKICKSDETNVQRSLFQLSLIPPNERDPSRFKVKTDSDKEEINYAEFEDFCKKHPQLVRRLHDGMMRESLGEHRRQFTCSTAADVVRFLADNQRVPSPFEDVPSAPVGQWQKRDDVKLRPFGERFPPLPPHRIATPPQHIFDERELTADQVGELPDSVDGHTMARAWYAYAQEPIPDPDDLPGDSKPITDRALQRKPKQITTLIFRNHPAHAQSNIAERLQQEGWFDNELWLIKDWFPNDRFVTGKDDKNQLPEARVGDDRVKWSLEAWSDARDRWRRHGEENHLLFRNAAEEANMRQMAEQFCNSIGIPNAGRPPALRTETLSEAEREGYHAMQFLYENRFYRTMSNFDAHMVKSTVDAKEDTVAGRKNFYVAERLRWAAEVVPALNRYLAALIFWRDKVFLPPEHKDYRLNGNNQEEAFDWQYHYLRLYHEQWGARDKLNLAKLARVLPLAPATDPVAFSGWILQGPLDVTDSEGHQLIDDDAGRTCWGGSRRRARHQATAVEPPPAKGSDVVFEGIFAGDKGIDPRPAERASRQPTRSKAARWRMSS